MAKRSLGPKVTAPVEGIDKVEIEIDRLSYFEKNNQYIIWFGLKENSTLRILENKIYSELEKEKFFYCDKEEFVGHITLLRIKKGNYNIAYFYEGIKPLVLNATNAKVIK